MYSKDFCELDVKSVIDWFEEVERFFKITNVEEEPRVAILAY